MIINCYFVDANLNIHLIILFFYLCLYELLYYFKAQEPEMFCKFCDVVNENKFPFTTSHIGMIILQYETNSDGFYDSC